MADKYDMRHLLGKVRKLQESNSRIGSLNSEDIIKHLNESKQPKNKLILLKENEIQDVSSDEQREEENKFKDIVSKLVRFDKIKVYRQNVEWSGELVREKVKWVFSLNENNGCYISINSEDMLQLTTEVIELMKKLRGYYDVWSDEWSQRLTGSPSTEEEGTEDTIMDNPEADAAGGTKGEGTEEDGFKF